MEQFKHYITVDFQIPRNIKAHFDEESLQDWLDSVQEDALEAYERMLFGRLKDVTIEVEYK